MSDAIHSVTGFCKQLKKGDVFWHITSLHGEPYAVEGPCEILAIFLRDRNSIVMVRYARPWVDATECIVEDAVSDLVNKHHGVFLNYADVGAEFDWRRGALAEEQKLAFEFPEKSISGKKEEQWLVGRFDYSYRRCFDRDSVERNKGESDEE